MKKLSIILLSLLLIFSATACSASKSTDEAFITDLQSGLTARWKLTTDPKTNETSTKNFNSYIDAELDAISSYKDATFENQELGDLAKGYIEDLEKIKENTQYIDSDYNMFNSKATPYMQDRTAKLVKINEISPLSFKNQSDTDTFNGLLEDGKTVIAVQDIMKAADFKAEPPAYEGSTWITYSCIVENTSSVDFKSFEFDIELLDANGVVVDTPVVYLQNWTAGSKQRAEFSTDKTFTEMKINNCSWSY